MKSLTAGWKKHMPPGDADDERFERLEATMREIEKVQSELRSEQTGLKWMAGIVVGILVAGTGVSLTRSFVLSDSVAAVQVDTGKISTTLEFVREDVSELKSDVKAVRIDLERVAVAVGVNQPPEKKAELELRQ
jgi:hypothetical protein